MLVRDPQLRELSHFGCVAPEDDLVAWATLHVSCEERESSRVPSYHEITVPCAALMQSYLGCCEQFGCLLLSESCREAEGGSGKETEMLAGWCTRRDPWLGEWQMV